MTRLLGERGTALAYRIFVGEYLYSQLNPSGTFAIAKTDERFLAGAGGWSERKARPKWPPFRWALLPEACLVLPLDQPATLRVAVTGRAPGGRGASDPVPAAIKVNGNYLTSIHFPSDWGTVRFTMPGEQLRSGRNLLCFDFGRQSMEGRADPGAAISVIQLP